MLKKFVAILLSVCSITLCFATDTYDSSTGILSIPLLNVGGTTGKYYTNVQVTIGSVLAVNSATGPTPGYDTYNSSTNQLAIPFVTVSGVSYSNVYITIGQVLYVGGTCASVSTCAASTTSSVSSSSTGLVDSANCTSATNSATLSSDAVYYAPQSYKNLIQTCIQQYTLSAASSPLSSRNYYMLSDSPLAKSTANFLQIGSTYSSTSGFSAF
jgi:hypothetical protein